MPEPIYCSECGQRTRLGACIVLEARAGKHKAQAVLCCLECGYAMLHRAFRGAVPTTRADAAMEAGIDA